MKMIDKAIALNFKLIKEPLQMIVVMSVCIAMCFVFIIFIPVAIILGFVVTYMLIKIYKTLFIDSIFGESESIYNALPIPAKEGIVSRIFVAVVATAAAEILVALGVVIGFCIMLEGWNLVPTAVGVLGVLYEAGLPVAVLLLPVFLVINYCVITITFASCIQSYKRTGKSGPSVAGSALTLVCLMNVLISVAPYSFIAPYVAIIYAAALVVLFVLSIVSIKYIKKNF